MTLRVGIIGCGAIAEYLHAPAIYASGCCTLSAVVDPDTARAEKLAAKYDDVAVSTSLSEVSGAVDFVVLATPPHSHVSLALEAFNLGLHVLIEKPLANTVSECEQIAQAASEHSKIAGVFHQFRFWPNRQEIAEKLASGAWQIPRRVSVAQGRPYSWSPATGYTFRRDLVSGGVLINAGTHPLDSLISWFGDPLDFEYYDDACGGLESNARMSMTFEGGVVGDFRISRTCNLANEIKIWWDGFTTVMNNQDAFHYSLRKDEGAHELISCGGPEKSFHQPAVNLYTDFCNSIVNGRDPQVNVREGTRVLRWVEGCYLQKRLRELPRLSPTPGLTW